MSTEQGVDIRSDGITVQKLLYRTVTKGAKATEARFRKQEVGGNFGARPRYGAGYVTLACA